MNDKMKHLCAGMAVAAVVALPCYFDTLSLFAGLWAAFVSAAVAGGVKEFFDNTTPGNRWNWVDLGFTILGAVFVAGFIVLLHFGKG